MLRFQWDSLRRGDHILVHDPASADLHLPSRRGGVRRHPRARLRRRCALGRRRRSRPRRAARALRRALRTDQRPARLLALHAAGFGRIGDSTLGEPRASGPRRWRVHETTVMASLSTHSIQEAEPDHGEEGPVTGARQAVPGTCGHRGPRTGGPRRAPDRRRGATLCRPLPASWTPTSIPTPRSWRSRCSAPRWRVGAIRNATRVRRSPQRQHAKPPRLRPDGRAAVERGLASCAGHPWTSRLAWALGVDGRTVSRSLQARRLDGADRKEMRCRVRQVATPARVEEVAEVAQGEASRQEGQGPIEASVHVTGAERHPSTTTLTSV
jgi:hypothetical protein